MFIEIHNKRLRTRTDLIIRKITILEMQSRYASPNRYHIQCTETKNGSNVCKIDQ